MDGAKRFLHRPHLKINREITMVKELYDPHMFNYMWESLDQDRFVVGVNGAPSKEAAAAALARMKEGLDKLSPATLDRALRLA